MAKQDELKNSENESRETTEQAEISSRLKFLAEQERQIRKENQERKPAQISREEVQRIAERQKEMSKWKKIPGAPTPDWEIAEEEKNLKSVSELPERKRAYFRDSKNKYGQEGFITHGAAYEDKLAEDEAKKYNEEHPIKKFFGFGKKPIEIIHENAIAEDERREKEKEVEIKRQKETQSTRAKSDEGRTMEDIHQEAMENSEYRETMRQLKIAKGEAEKILRRGDFRGALEFMVLALEAEGGGTGGNKINKGLGSSIETHWADGQDVLHQKSLTREDVEEYLKRVQEYVLD